MLPNAHIVAEPDTLARQPIEIRVVAYPNIPPKLDVPREQDLHVPAQEEPVPAALEPVPEKKTAKPRRTAPPPQVVEELAEIHLDPWATDHGVAADCPAVDLILEYVYPLLVY